MMETDILFVHIQKTGGSSIMRGLGRRPNHVHKHRFAHELREIYTPAVWDSAYRFAVVRNPWDRLVSWWSMVNMYREAHAQGGYFNNFFAYVLGRARTFEDFILNCGDDVEDPDGFKCIFRNQIDYVIDADGQVMVDFIGRFETLESDFRHVLAETGRPATALEHVNRSRHRPYQDYYSPKTRDIVEKAYARDIARFEYRFEG